MSKVDTDPSSLFGKDDMKQIDIESTKAKHPYTPKTPEEAADWENMLTQVPAETDQDSIPRPKPEPKPENLVPVIDAHNPRYNPNDPLPDKGRQWAYDQYKRDLANGDVDSTAKKVVDLDDKKREELGGIDSENNLFLQH